MTAWPGGEGSPARPPFLEEEKQPLIPPRRFPSGQKALAGG